MEAVKRIRQLYETTGARQSFPIYRDGLDRMLEGVEGQPPSGFSLDQLKAYYATTDYSVVLSLALLLANLPAEPLRETLGNEALFWTFVNAPYDTESKRLLSAYASLNDRRPEDLEKSRVFIWQMQGPNGAQEVKTLSELTYAINNGILKEIALEPVLDACVNRGVATSAGRSNDYALLPLNSQGDRPYGLSAERPYIYLDTPVGFELSYRNQPNAAVGLGTTPGETLMLYQIQGITLPRFSPERKVIGKISPRGLAPYDWRKVIVDCTSKIASMLGFKKVAIQTGERNPWTRVRYKDGSLHLDPARAKENYDNLAKRLRFKRDKDKNWYRNVQEL